jgi:hypothetical protein
VGLVVMLLRRRSKEALVLDMKRDMGGSRWMIFVYTLGMLELRRFVLYGYRVLLRLGFLKVFFCG